MSTTQPIPAEAFNYNKATMTLSAEASMLGLRPGFTFGPIYADACDEGIKVVGRRNTVTYYLAETQKNRDQEVEAWVLLPDSQSTRRTPACKGTKVMIFND